MMQRFLDPAVLAGISSLDLLAKTVVDGFVAGSASFAGLRLQPGVCGVSRVYAGGRSAACGLESVCADGAVLSEAVSRARRTAS